MKIEAVFCLVLAILFTAMIPLGLWLDGSLFTKASLGAAIGALAFWLGYFRARELDRKIKNSRHEAQSRTKGSS